MARKPVVSRTFTTFTCTATIVHRETAEISQYTFVATRKLSDKKLVKAIEEKVGLEYVILKVTDPIEKIIKKSMDEAKFFELAETVNE